MVQKIVPISGGVLAELRSVDPIFIISPLAPVTRTSEKDIWETPCPACDDKLLINVHKNIMHCLYCCFAGDLVSYVMLKEEMPINEAIQYILKRK